MSEVVQVERNGGVATIRMNRPDRLNAYNTEMGDALLAAALSRLGRPVGAVRRPDRRGKGVLRRRRRGDDGVDPGGRHGGLPGPHGPPARLHRHLRRAPKPVVAAVNGVAAGAGFSMALACDVAVATASARFTLGYQNIGLSPDGGMTFFLARALGTQRAMEMTLFSKVLSAEQAAAWGLVQQVFPDAEFAAQTAAIAARPRRGTDVGLRAGEGSVQPRAEPAVGNPVGGGAAEHRPLRDDPRFPRRGPRLSREASGALRGAVAQHLTAVVAEAVILLEPDEVRHVSPDPVDVAVNHPLGVRRSRIVAGDRRERSILEEGVARPPSPEISWRYRL